MRVKVWHNGENEDKCGLGEIERVGFVWKLIVSFRAQVASGVSFVEPKINSFFPVTKSESPSTSTY